MKKLHFLAIAALALALQACSIVSSGNVGIERSLGKVTTAELPPGQYVTIIDSVDEVTTKEVVVPLNDLTPKSRDNLTMQEVDIDVYYKVDPSKPADLFIKYQGDMRQHRELVENGTSDYVIAPGRVQREAREAIYTAIAKFDATTMHTKRAEIAEEIRKELQAALDASDPNTFFITAVNVRSIKTDKAIENAIRAQVALDQDIMRKEKAIVLEQKEAERKRVAALGQAEANNILNNSLTGQLVQLQLAEIRRQTVVGAAGKGNTVIVDAEATPLISK